MNQQGSQAFVDSLIIGFHRVWEDLGFQCITTFNYSGHNRNATTDALVNLFYTNYKGVWSSDGRYSWDNQRLLHCTRLDHEAESPAFLNNILDRMETVIDTEQVLLLYGHGITDDSRTINRYTSTRTLVSLFEKALELGLKIYTQEELFALFPVLKISNVIVSNSTEQDYYGDYPPYVEVTNTSDNDISVQGYWVSNSASNKSVSR